MAADLIHVQALFLLSVHGAGEALQREWRDPTGEASTCRLRRRFFHSRLPLRGELQICVSGLLQLRTDKICPCQRSNDKAEL